VRLLWQLGQDDPEHSVFTWAAANLPAPTLQNVDEIDLSLAVTELGCASEDLDRTWWRGTPGDLEGAALSTAHR
jgi:hypothetical protein